ncbi:MAG TPA: hypothetical protein V6C85_13390 [Allocoleopsis sp.]
MSTKQELESLYQKYCVINHLVEKSEIPVSIILSLTNLLQESQCDFSRPETEEYLSLLRLLAQEMLDLSNAAIASITAIDTPPPIDWEIGGECND